MAARQRQLGWPFWVASATVFLCLTLGTFTILGKNFANNFYVAGSRQFETVGPATVANIVAQLLLGAVVVVVAFARPTWRSGVFVVVAFLSIAAFLILNAWAQTSVP